MSKQAGNLLALRIRNLIAAREFNTAQANRELQCGDGWLCDHGQYDRELADEMVRYFNVFVSAAFVFVCRYLATGDIQLFHQLAGQPAPHFDARVPADDGSYASGAGRAAAGVPGLHDLAASDHTLAVGLIR